MKKFILVLTVLLGGLFSGSLHAIGQTQNPTTTDVFITPGSDFVRPGLAPRINFNVGIGHTFGHLGAVRLGDEITVAYTYENAGSHGFFHSKYGSHTEAAGLMKNFPVYKKLSGYTWEQLGVTSFTGNKNIQNRMYTGLSIGAAYHLDAYNAIWVQEQYNKINTTPWYTTTSVGYAF